MEKTLCFAAGLGSRSSLQYEMLEPPISVLEDAKLESSICRCLDHPAAGCVTLGMYPLSLSSPVY